MSSHTPPSLLALPAELRLAIISHVLLQSPTTGYILPRAKLSSTRNLRVDGDDPRSQPPPLLGLILNRDYSSSSHLSILLVCRQFRHDFTALAFQCTRFHISNMYTPFTDLLRPLCDIHIRSLRKIVVVAGAKHFREMVHWVRYPWNMENLKLEELTVAMHRSTYSHYPADFTTDLVGMLRRLQNVKVLKFMLNGATVKGFFKTWYNRLIGLVLKEDHFQRYDAPGAPNLEDTWWTWNYDENARWFDLLAHTPKPVMVEGEYMEMVKPLVQKLVRDMEEEEEDHDPRVINGF